jgi:hypothetical protein
MGDGRQAFYRARDYWQPGTTIDVRIALDGYRMDISYAMRLTWRGEFIAGSALPVPADLGG